MREINAILGFMWSLQKVNPSGSKLEVDADLSCSALAAQSLAADALEQSLAMCPELPQKRQRLLSSQHWCSWGVSLPPLLNFVERLELLPLVWECALCGARVVLLLWWRILARFAVWLGGVMLVFRTCFKMTQICRISWETFSFSFPVWCVNSLNEFSKAGKSVGLVVVNHIIFDVLGESIYKAFVGVLHCPTGLMRLAAETS